MPDNDTPEPAAAGRSPSELLEMASRGTVVLIGLAYVLGLLIVNLHLLRFGVRSVTLLRSDYVMAGAMWLVLLGLGYVAHLVSLGQFVRARRRWLNGERWRSVLACIAEQAVTYLALTVILLRLTDRLVGRRDWFALVVIAGTPIALLNARDVVTRALTSYRRSVDDLDERPPTFTVALQLVLILVHLSWYAEYVYPRILPAFGGGSPALVRLVIDPSTAARLAKAPKPASVTAQPDDPVYELIADTGDWLIVVQRASGAQSERERRRSAIRVRKEEVAAVIAVAEP